MQKRNAQIDALGMGHAAQICAGGVVETHLGPVIGMGAPTDVVQQTGRADQALFVMLGAWEKRLDEMIELATKTGHARQLRLGMAGCFDQRVARLERLGHLFVKQPLAQPVGGDCNLARL